jgi:hypothetical protein
MRKASVRKTIAIVTVSLALAGGALTWSKMISQSGSHDAVVACKGAIKLRWEALLNTGVVPETGRPDECDGVSDADLARIGSELSAETATNTP